MLSSLISRLITLIFGALLPAYRSFKAIKSRNVNEYFKWMMYWVVFASYLTIESFSDLLLSWLPFYYESKVLFLIWLLSPFTKGSALFYRKFLHPRLKKHEKVIDAYICEAQRSGYSVLMDVGKKGFNVASEKLMQTAISSQACLTNTWN